MSDVDVSHAVTNLEDRPLVTLPTSVRETISEKVAISTGPMYRLTSDEERKPLELAVGTDDLDPISTDASFSLCSTTQPSEVKSVSSSSDCRTDYLELLSPSFAHFLSLTHAALLPEDEAFMARASQLVEDMLDNSAYLQNAETVGLAFTELLQPIGEDVYHTHQEGTISIFCRIEDEDIQSDLPSVHVTRLGRKNTEKWFTA
ncbi:hypothetical protein K466DRAFT_668519 [Polyporus arcularius HHB13444]|uniref:Uncharacterized protein n=1 Tax=Polyporus arcularius HHB13444 TaxID=1314778 RepID=A0A5C3NLQ4_9APHY|nr:hypothetical protein K466DRAFT_668519 [Polyporus arcularius HHB13444]